MIIAEYLDHVQFNPLTLTADLLTFICINMVINSLIVFIVAFTLLISDGMSI